MIEHPSMEFYRHVYKNSPRMPFGIKDKTVIIYCEQGFGDIIQCARYFKLLEGNKVILHCPKELHRLFHFNFPEMQILDKDCAHLPKHDYHILSMSLLEEYIQQTIDVPYLKVEGKFDVGEDTIGIAWEGKKKPNLNRSCHLKYFRGLSQKYKLFSLQKDFSSEMSDGCEDMELYGVSINDFYDVAMLINSVEQVISIDTAILHLAGAMNKPTIGLLSNDTDERWRIRNWYPSVKLMQGSWEGMLKNIMNSLEEVALEPISFNWTVDDFVVTKAVKQYCEDS
jgi:hypothetical protein